MDGNGDGDPPGRAGGDSDGDADRDVEVDEGVNGASCYESGRDMSEDDEDSLGGLVGTTVAL